MDRALLERHLAHILDQVALLHRRAEPGRIATDPVQLAFVTYTLQTAIQAAIDAAALIVAERRCGAARTHRELFEKLAGDGWLPEESLSLWRRIVAFRNVVVHRYVDVDHEVVAAIARDHLGDLRSFARAIRRRLDGEVGP
ncbi:MAG: DUF86 domain-containing protein [Planctomycetes bacterium]|nr:DUF86 domain-containing protein [Planctomycetota bacterium]